MIHVHKSKMALFPIGASVPHLILVCCELVLSNSVFLLFYDWLLTHQWLCFSLLCLLVGQKLIVMYSICSQHTLWASWSLF